MIVYAVRMRFTGNEHYDKYEPLMIEGLKRSEDDKDCWFNACLE
jgi:hypothetical protein